MKKIALICVLSRRQEIRQFHGRSHEAVYLSLSKTALVCHSDMQYQLYCCRPSDNIRAWSKNTDFCILYFLCSSQEIADFLTMNFRNINTALYLLNGSYYHTIQKIQKFEKLYRLPVHSAWAVSSNINFQAAISQKKENQFLYFYNQNPLYDQNAEYLEQMQRIHHLTAAHMNGGQK
jgi:hypothetical protein